MMADWGLMQKPSSASVMALHQSEMLQVKLRGQRLEPGEVESVLTSQAAVAAAHVTLVHHPATNEAQLMAYVSPASCDRQALLEACKQQLPRHMVPSLFMAIPSLPQLPSGKVNPRELPPPDWSQQAAADASEGPRSDPEAKVLDVMKDVLHSDAVGVHSDFFSMGGSSMLAHAVASGASEATGVAVQPGAVFQHTTAASLAAHVAESMDEVSPDTAPVEDIIQAAPYSEAERIAGVPCSFNQEQMYLAHEQLDTKHTYNVPMGLKLAGALEPVALQKALEVLQDRHEALRTSFRSASDGRPLQCIQPARKAAPLSLATARADSTNGRSAEAILHEEAQAPFDLSRPPLLRILLVTVSPMLCASDGHLHVQWHVQWHQGRF